MENPFARCWDRVRRAYRHLAEAADLWNAYLAREPYVPRLVLQPDGTGSLSITQESEVPPEISLELGECLYQLRSALDGCVYRAAILETGIDPPPKHRQLEFPICHVRDAFEKAASTKLFSISGGVRAVIESMQPYNAPVLEPALHAYNFNLLLGILNDWARKDRHRSLHLVASLASSIDPLLAVPHGVRATIERVDEELLLLRPYECAIVARIAVEQYEPTMRILANPNLILDIAVDEQPRPKHENDSLRIRGKGMARAVEAALLGVQAALGISGSGIHDEPNP